MEMDIRPRPSLVPAPIARKPSTALSLDVATRRRACVLLPSASDGGFVGRRYAVRPTRDAAPDRYSTSLLDVQRQQGTEHKASACERHTPGDVTTGMATVTQHMVKEVSAGARRSIQASEDSGLATLRPSVSLPSLSSVHAPAVAPVVPRTVPSLPLLPLPPAVMLSHNKQGYPSDWTAEAEAEPNERVRPLAVPLNPAVTEAEFQSMLERARLSDDERRRLRTTKLLRPSATYHTDRRLRGYWIGGPLRTSWTVRVEHSRLNQGFLFIGVCDATGQTAWGLHPYSGLLYRLARDPTDGRVFVGLPPPPGYPDGNLNRVMVTNKGRPDSLNGRAQGAVIECRLDVDSVMGTGTLCFRINGSAPLRALADFPSGAKLREWALVCDPNDSVLLE